MTKYINYSDNFVAKINEESFQILYEQHKDALKIIKNLKKENEQLKQENKELKEELFEVIDVSSDNRPNKKGFMGNGRFA